MQIDEGDFIGITSDGGLDGVDLLALLPLGAIGDREQSQHDEARLRQPTSEHLRDRPLSVGDVLWRAVGSEVPHFFATGAFGDAEVVDAAEQHRDFGLPVGGEVEIAARHAMQHDRGDVAGISHIDRVIGDELLLPDRFAGGGAQRP